MTLVDFLTGFHAVPLWLNRPFGFATAPNSCDHCQSLYFPGKFHSSTCSAVMVTLKISTRLSRSFILALRNCLTFTHSHLHTYVHTCIREYLEYSCELSECKRERVDLSSQRPCGCSALLSPFLSFSAGGNQIYFQFASKTHPHTHTRGRSLVCLFVCRVCYSLGWLVFIQWNIQRPVQKFFSLTDAVEVTPETFSSSCHMACTFPVQKRIILSFWMEY